MRAYWSASIEAWEDIVRLEEASVIVDRVTGDARSVPPYLQFTRIHAAVLRAELAALDEYDEAAVAHKASWEALVVAEGDMREALDLPLDRPPMNEATAQAVLFRSGAVVMLPAAPPLANLRYDPAAPIATTGTSRAGRKRRRSTRPRAAPDRPTPPRP